MIDLPQWLEDRIEEMECPNCSRNIQLKSIIGIGIKEYDNKKNKKKDRVSYLVIEHTCEYCHKTYGFDISICDVKEFVFDMMEKYGLINDGCDQTETSDAKKESKKSRSKKSGISQSEVDSFRMTLKDCKSWTDIMNKVGISNEDIDRYAKD